MWSIEENLVPVIRIQIQVHKVSSISASESSREMTIEQAWCICFVYIMCCQHWLYCHFIDFFERSSFLKIFFWKIFGEKWGHFNSGSAASLLSVEQCFRSQAETRKSHCSCKVVTIKRYCYLSVSSCVNLSTPPAPQLCGVPLKWWIAGGRKTKGGWLR